MLNYFFKVISAFTVMLCGWYVTSPIIEPPLRQQIPEDMQAAGDGTAQQMALTPR
jgi:p-aminobenzoyl-glutamate transporter AbgT